MLDSETVKSSMAYDLGAPAAEISTRRENEADFLHSLRQAIAEARAHGDLKENAEYHAAKDQQGFIEGRIKELEGKLSNLQVIDVTVIDAKGRIVFGSTVELLDEASGTEIVYKCGRLGGWGHRWTDSWCGFST